MSDISKTKVGIIGAGKVGTSVARLAIEAGYPTRVATRKAPAENKLILDFLAPGAEAAAIDDVLAGSDIIVLALPLRNYHSISPAALAGKVVIDAMNYWAPTDGTLAEFEAAASSSAVLQDYFADAHVVRTLNHLGYQQLLDNARPFGDAGRQAMAVMGNDAAARSIVADFIDHIGFDPVDGGTLAGAHKTAVAGPAFGTWLDRKSLAALLAD